MNFETDFTEDFYLDIAFFDLLQIDNDKLFFLSVLLLSTIGIDEELLWELIFSLIW